ncbi:hypothetical protein DFS34DRAFT_684653 [Phlyctochytrium arcticum]|nr:hypothetical protein DFS34DRAFT_684653 [Phlyctochytrium arcticum]
MSIASLDHFNNHITAASTTSSSSVSLSSGTIPTDLLTLSLIRTYLSDVSLRRTLKVFLHELSILQDVPVADLQLLKRRDLERELEGIFNSGAGTGPILEVVVQTAQERSKAKLKKDRIAQNERREQEGREETLGLKDANEDMVRAGQSWVPPARTERSAGTSVSKSVGSQGESTPKIAGLVPKRVVGTSRPVRLVGTTGGSSSRLGPQLDEMVDKRTPIAESQAFEQSPSSKGEKISTSPSRSVRMSSGSSISSLHSESGQSKPKRVALGTTPKSQLHWESSQRTTAAPMSTSVRSGSSRSGGVTPALTAAPIRPAAAAPSPTRPSPRPTHTSSSSSVRRQPAQHHDLEITAITPTTSDDESDPHDKLLLHHVPALPTTHPTPLSQSDAQDLHNMIWGAQRPPPTWLTTNLVLNTNRQLPYGLVQERGGPCGVLAGIQAALVRVLLDRGQDIATVTREQAESALWRGVADILWRAKGKEDGKVIVPLLNTATLTTLPLSLTLHTLPTLDLLTAFLSHRRPTQLLPFLYALLLTRSARKVTSDMDEPGNALIGAHGYCTQELVNLILTGRAVSNVFDGVNEAEGFVMRGITTRAQTGFLSLFESYGTLCVGKHYKQPSYPVWTIHSESHYTTLFATRRTLITENPRTFELLYYDGLANQEGEIRIRVTRDMGVVDSDDQGDLVPPLERCVRTNWPGAKVEWINCDPIL